MGALTICHMSLVRFALYALFALTAPFVLTGCGNAEEDAVDEVCLKDLDWSSPSAGAASDDSIASIADSYDADLTEVYDGAQGACPGRFDGFSEWVLAGEGEAEDEDELSGGSGSGGAKTSFECGELGGWVARQDAAGEFTPEEYDSWLQIVEDCHRDATE